MVWTATVQSSKLRSGSWRAEDHVPAARLYEIRQEQERLRKLIAAHQRRLEELDHAERGVLQELERCTSET